MTKVDVYKGDKKENGLELSQNNKTILWKDKNAIIATMDFENKLKIVVEKFGNNGQNINPDELSQIFENKNYKMKICIQQLGVEMNNGEYLIHNLDGYFLFTKK